MEIHNQSLCLFLHAASRRRRDNSHGPTTCLVLPLISYALLPIVQPTVQRACWWWKLPHLRPLVGDRNGPEVGFEEVIYRGQQALRPPDLRRLPASVRDFDALGGWGHHCHCGLGEVEREGRA